MSIRVTSLNFSVATQTILKDIDFELASNQVTILIGPNGAGKSTLLKACAGDIPSCQHAIVVNGKNLSGYSASELARYRAVMTQSYEMGFNFSVEEVVRMGCFVHENQLSHEEQGHMINSVMTFMGIQHLAHHPFTHLSGGEQQRTQLARVLIQIWHPFEQQDARFLLLDEPTSSLDIFHQYQVLTLAQQLTRRNIGVLAVVHDLSLAASFADHLVLMSDGKIVAQGKAGDILQQKYLSDVYQIKGYYYQRQDNVRPCVLIET